MDTLNTLTLACTAACLLGPAIGLITYALVTIASRALPGGVTLTIHVPGGDQ